MKITKERVYELLRTVPRGRVTTYKLLARALGSRAYRAVGQILRVNPDAPRTPCHRVIASDGTLGGFMGDTAGLSLRKKISLLRSEGVEVKEKAVVGFKKILFDPGL